MLNGGRKSFSETALTLFVESGIIYTSLWVQNVYLIIYMIVTDNMTFQTDLEKHHHCPWR